MSIASLLVTALVLGGCTTDGADEPQRPQPIEYPRGADVVVVSVRPHGAEGPGAPGSYYRTHSFWLYGDRRMIMVGPPDKQHQRSKWPFIGTRVLAEREMQDVLRAFRKAGFLGPQKPDFGTPEVQYGPDDDPSRDTVSINAAGVQREVVIIEGVPEDIGLTERQREMRISFGVAVERLGSLPESLPRYRPSHVALLVKPANVRHQAVRRWPLNDLNGATEWAGTSANGTHCLVAPADQAQRVAEVMDSSPRPVLWRSSGGAYRVTVHPMLPDERDCASAHPYL